MARRNNLDELIHCEVCGEDYSPTYRRCPFCGEKPSAPPPAPNDDEDFDDGYVFEGQHLFDEDSSNDNRSSANKGGKRLASGSTAHTGARHVSHHHTAIHPMRIVTFALSLIIIIAALIIIFTVVYPSLHKKPTPSPMPSDSPAISSPIPGGPSSAEPTSEPTEQPSDEPVDPTDQPSQSSEVSLTLSTYDFTLTANEKHTITVVVEPDSHAGDVVWSSSNSEYATVSKDGTVTNVNTTTSLRRVIITATIGDVSEECVVYCRGSASGSDAPPVATPTPTPTPTVNPSNAPSASLDPGTTAVIVNAAGGLNVRSGPGTTYDRIASLTNGGRVVIKEYAGNDWYKIDYGGGRIGYVMAEFLAKY